MKNLTACLLVSLGPILPSIAADPSPSTWEQGEGFRRARRVAPPNTAPGFTPLAPAQTGIHAWQ